MTFVDIAPADQTAVDAMWASYVADSGYDGPLVMAFAFGDSAEMADELGLLVLHGPKRATAGLVQAFVLDEDNSAVPVDQVKISETDQDSALFLPAGKYRIRAVDKTGVTIKEFQITIN